MCWDAWPTVIYGRNSLVDIHYTIWNRSGPEDEDHKGHGDTAEAAFQHTKAVLPHLRRVRSAPRDGAESAVCRALGVHVGTAQRIVAVQAEAAEPGLPRNVW